MDPAIISALISSGGAAAQTAGGLWSSLIGRTDNVNPSYQTRQGLSQAAGDIAYLNSMFPHQLAMNDAELAHNMETYKSLGLNPLLAVPQNASQGSYQSSQRNPVSSQPDLASAFQPLMALAPMLREFLDFDAHELERKSKELDNFLKQQNIDFRAEEHADTMDFNRLRKEQLSDQISQSRESHRAMMSNMLAKNMTENERARLTKLQADMQDLLIQKEQAYSQFYDEVARLEKEGLDRKNALMKAQESKEYKKCQEVDSKIALNNKKCEQIQSDLDSDPANHATALVDEIADPEKHPILNHGLKYGALLLTGAAQKTNPFKFK